MTPPVIFEGGPLTYNPTLIQVFAQRLGLREDQIIRPGNADTIVALGAALAMDELYPLPTGRAAPMTPEQALERLSAAPPAAGQHHTERYFGSDAERDAWRASHALPALQTPDVRPGDTLRVYIGVDAGSTTSKLVLLDENETVLDRFYASNRGDPIEVIRHGLQELYKKYSAIGVKLEVLGFGTTGYGEVMLSKAFGGDYHTVETVAHAAAACHYLPDVTFLLDIGGQDMKAIWIQDGVVTNMLLNEACSSGCGSFLAEFAASLGIPVEGIADAAFRAQNPAELGSRCTVLPSRKTAAPPTTSWRGCAAPSSKTSLPRWCASPTPMCWAAGSWCRAAPLKTTRCSGRWSSTWAAPSPVPPTPARWAPSARLC